MSDEQPVPATLESIAEQIRDLGTSINGRLAQVDERFAQIDTRFAHVDERFDELKAQLETEIEAVRGDVRLVAEALAAQHAHNRQNEAEHKAFLRRIENHDVRILALEPKRDSA